MTHSDIVQEIIDEVRKHHKMEMNPVCAESLLNLLKKHCPIFNKEEENKGEKLNLPNENLKCNPCDL